jgi:uncharacterized membrane protein YqjE
MAMDTGGDRSISSVLRDIVQNVQDIVRSELRLAKIEIGEELTKAKTAVVLLGISAVGGFLAVFFALIAAVFALSKIVPNWAAALIVAAAMGIGAAALAYAGRKRLRRVNTIPAHTVENLKENIQWAKQQTK